MAVNASKYLPAGTPKTEGLVNKFGPSTPRSVTTRSGTASSTTPSTAKYEGTEKVDGAGDLQVPLRRRPSRTPTIADGVEGTYSMDKTMWIEPATGQIIDQEQHDVRAVDGKTLLDVAALVHRRPGEHERRTTRSRTSPRST